MNKQMMTEAEDAHNAKLNEMIRLCPHESVEWKEGMLRCVTCPARFEVTLFPRFARASIMCGDPDYDEEKTT